VQDVLDNLTAVLNMCNVDIVFQSNMAQLFFPTTHKRYVGLYLRNVQYNCSICQNSNYVLVSMTYRYKLKLHCQKQSCKNEIRQGLDEPIMIDLAEYAGSPEGAFLMDFVAQNTEDDVET